MRKNPNTTKNVTGHCKEWHSGILNIPEFMVNIFIIKSRDF